MARELVIFVGLQAAGKSSFFRERFGATHAHVSKDLMPRAARDKESRQLGQIEQALLIGRPVVVDNTNPRAADSITAGLGVAIFRGEMIELRLESR